MQAAETVGVAIGALRVNRLRSVLTILGVVIGVAAVITMVSVGAGAQRAVEDRIARLGTTVVRITPRRIRQGGVESADPARLTLRDVEAIRARARHVAGVAYQQDRRLPVVWRDRNASVRVTGTKAVTLCLLGGAIGVGAGVLASGGLRLALGWATAVEPWSIAVAFGVALAIGLVFGVWPARRAGSLDPIEALRFE